jgi:hypothetical protein
MWSRWLNDTLLQSGARFRPSVQEERILRLAEWIAYETHTAKAAKDAALTSDTQKIQ